MRLSKHALPVIEKLLAENLDTDSMATVFGVPRQTIYAFLRRNGLKAAKKLNPALSARDQAVAEMYKSGKTLQECGDAFGISRERARQILNKQGVQDRRLWSFDKSGRGEYAKQLYTLGESIETIAAETDTNVASLHQYFAQHGRPAFDERRRNMFWRYAAITADPERCWLWQAGTDASGYGKFCYKSKPDTCHRIAFEFANGRKPTKWVLHKCDTPRCVNPRHLYEGTPQDNVRDRDARGRLNPSGRKLTAAHAAEIKRLLARRDRSQSEIAATYGVGLAAISKINRGITWKNISL